MLTPSRCSSPSPSAKVSSSNPDRRNRWASLDKPALGIALAIGVLTAGQAQAFVVHVGGQNWDVTTFIGSYNNNVNKFETPTNGGVMPWWGDSNLAVSFAESVGSSIEPPFTGYTPFFGFTVVSNVPGIPYIQGPFVWSRLFNEAPGLAFFGSHVNGDYRYAIATLAGQTPGPLPPSTTTVPGPLPALGAAAAFGFSRQLRNRIKRSNKAASSSYSL
jgi:hypothetical protein